MIADFADVVFQSNPFKYRVAEWKDHQLGKRVFAPYQNSLDLSPNIYIFLCTLCTVVFQEFHPNMVISRSPAHKEIFLGCYGEENLKTYGHQTVISSGTVIGTRNAVLIWAHSVTGQVCTVHTISHRHSNSVFLSHILV